MEISVKSTKVVESIAISDNTFTFDGTATSEDGVFTNLVGTLRDTNNNSATVECVYKTNNAQILISGSPDLTTNFATAQFIQAIIEQLKSRM